VWVRVIVILSTTQRYNIGIRLVKCFGIFLSIIFVFEDLFSKHKDEFIICEAVALVLPNLHRMMANGRWQFFEIELKHRKKNLIIYN
jgi:hypothetical protein